jgi:hypothetical protein
MDTFFPFSSDGARCLGQSTWWIGMIFDRMKRRSLWFSLRSRQKRFFQSSFCSFFDVCGAKCLNVSFLATAAKTLQNTSYCCDILCRGPRLDQSQPYLAYQLQIAAIVSLVSPSLVLPHIFAFPNPFPLYLSLSPYLSLLSSVHHPLTPNDSAARNWQCLL